MNSLEFLNYFKFRCKRMAVYFGAEKGKIIKNGKGEALVQFNGKDPLRWLPTSKLNRRIERDVDGSVIPDRYLTPLLETDLDYSEYQTIAFDDGSYGIYLGQDGNMLTMEGPFYRRIESAVGIIMEGDRVVNEKLLRKIERFS